MLQDVDAMLRSKIYIDASSYAKHVCTRHIHKQRIVWVSEQKRCLRFDKQSIVPDAVGASFSPLHLTLKIEIVGLYTVVVIFGNKFS